MDFGKFSTSVRGDGMTLVHFPEGPEHVASNVEVFCFMRIAELEAALRAIEPHLHLSEDPIVGDCVLRSRSAMLRMDADRIEAYESAVRKVRAALNSST